MVCHRKNPCCFLIFGGFLCSNQTVLYLSIDIENFGADSSISWEPRGLALYPALLSRGGWHALKRMTFSLLVFRCGALSTRWRILVLRSHLEKMQATPFIWSVIIKHRMKDFLRADQYEGNDWICSKRKIYQRSKSFISLFLLSLAIFTPIRPLVWKPHE